MPKLMVKIKNRFTQEIIEMPASELERYCRDKNWEYHIIKNYFNRNVHYADRHFYLYEKEEELLGINASLIQNKDLLETNKEALKSELKPASKKTKSKKE